MPLTPQQEQAFRSTRRLFLLLGLVLSAVGVFLTGRTVLFVTAAQFAQARVTHVDRKWSTSGNHSQHVFRPTLQFEDAAGRQHTVTLGHYSSEYEHSVGESVTILYDPASPQNVRVQGFGGTWAISLVVLILGCGAMLMALALGSALKRQRSRCPRPEGSVKRDG